MNMEQAPLMTIFGAGYLATFLARKAVKQGWRVQGLTRNPDRQENLLEAGFERVFLGNLESKDWWGAFNEVPDCVVNTVSSAGGGLEGYRQSYVEGNRSILEWVSQQEEPASFSKSSLIYTSSTGVYPDRDGSWVQEADVVTEPDGRAALLLEAESLVMEKGKSLFGKVYVLRLAGLYGPGRLFLARQLQESGTIAGTGEYYLNLLRIEDAASAILACAEGPTKKEPQVFNVSDGNPALKSEMVTWLGGQLGQSPPFFDPNKKSGFRSRGSKNRRVDPRAFREALGWSPEYPNYRKGFKELISA